MVHSLSPGSEKHNCEIRTWWNLHAASQPSALDSKRQMIDSPWQNKGAQRRTDALVRGSA